MLSAARPRPPQYGADTLEKFVAFYINRRYRLLGSKLVSQGGFSATVVDPRVIFKEALLLNASAVTLAHNHPGGSLTPSDHDIELTQELVEAGRLFRIPVAEHVIVTRDHEHGIIASVPPNRVYTPTKCDNFLHLI